MTEKTSKEYLEQIFAINKALIRLQRSRDDLRQQMFDIKSPSGTMNADKVQTTVSGDNMLRLIAKVDALERDIIYKQNALIDLKGKIIREIESVKGKNAKQTNIYRTILHERYVLLWKWEQIAEDLGKDLRYIYRLHGHALLAFERMKNEKNNF